MVNLENFKNLYEVRKTVRFELKPEFMNRKFNILSTEQSLGKILTDYENIVKDLQSFFYCEVETNGENEKFSLKNKESSDLIRIKHEWLQKFFTKEWYENRESIISKRFDKKKNMEIKTKNWTIISSNKFLKEFFENFFEEANENYENLSKLIKAPDYAKSRKSDIRFALQKLHHKGHLYKIYQLFFGEYIFHKNNDVDIKNLKNILENFQKNVNSIIESLKINESFGVPTENISLNYYTRRKTQKEYSEDIRKKSESLTKKFNGILGELYGIDKEVGIEQLYNEMKIFKANQKSAFLQLLQKKTDFNDYKTPFNYIDNKENIHKNFVVNLFYDLKEKNYKKMLDLTAQIEIEKNKEKRKSLKEERGRYFQFDCNKYIKFCDEYKKVAMEFGRRKAEITSLQREKILAERERGYAIFSKKGDDYYVNTFDIENSKGIYEELKNYKGNSGESLFFMLSSITLRALEKLCFGKNSTFEKGLVNKIDKKFTKIQKGSNKTIFKGKSELEKEGILVEFFIEVLQKQDSLGLQWRRKESIDFLKYCEDISSFEIALKQETYVLEEKKIETKKFQGILKQYNGNSYKITSNDLENNKERKVFSCWWNTFWQKENKKNYYNLRVNPEMVISLRKGNPEFEDKISFHRKKNDSFLLTMSLSHFSDKNFVDSAFMDNEEIQKNLIEFNKLFNENNSFEYFYGIDKGTNELATLGIYKKGENGLEKVNLSEEIPVYKITEKGLKYTKETLKKEPKEGQNPKTIHTLYKNPSLFMDEIENKEIFEKIEKFSCIGNLNAAKIIHGKLILNGDINSYLNLCKLSAKRLLYIAISEGKNRSEKIKFNEEEKAFFYEYENKGEIHPKNIFYINNFENITSKEKLEEEFNDYMKRVIDHNSDLDVSIVAINNIKNAVVANMVGIVAKLQEFFPGYIAWESWNNRKTLRDIEKNPAALGNLINDKIYQKLFLKKSVPPTLKKFRSEINQTIQHGQVVYIKNDDTSSACPVCNKELSNKKEIFKLFGHLTKDENSMHHLSDEEYDEKYQSDEVFRKDHLDKKGKKKQNIYLPGKIMDGKSCDYGIGNEDYPEFDFIKSGDDLATYNIAKKAKEYLEHLSSHQS